jgi:hypothetical protein
MIDEHLPEAAGAFVSSPGAERLFVDVGAAPKQATFRPVRSQRRKTRANGSSDRSGPLGNWPYRRFGWAILQILLVFGIQFGMLSATHAQDFSWTRSLPVQFQSANLGPFRGTETRTLVFLGGKLYAALADLNDPQLNNPLNSVPQILRLDSPDDAWVVEHVFAQPLPGSPNMKEYPSISILAGMQLTRNSLGQDISPIDALFAGMGSVGAGVDLFQKIGDQGTWMKVELVDAQDAPASLFAEVRSFTQYTDSQTGLQMVLAGTGPFGVFSGAYESIWGSVIWNTIPEPGSYDDTLSDTATRDENRVMSFTTCASRLYASNYNTVMVRNDGPTPSWQTIYQSPTTLPAVSSGFRGLTCVPNTSGPGDMLITALEDDPLQIYAIQLAPSYSGAVEFDVSDFLTSSLGTQVGYGIGAYNDMLADPYSTGPDGCPDRLIGLLATAPNFTGAYGIAYPSAMFLVRHCDATYELRVIADPRISPAPPLLATRTMVVSQFPGDPPGTVYAGGFDTSFHLPYDYNTDWIYRGIPK